MIKYRVIGCFPLVLMLQVVAQPASGEEASVQYHYSDEWTVVSAPPPAGPYRSVNIDPRVPGVGAVAPLPMDIQPLETVPAAPADSTLAEAPAIPPVVQPLEAEPAAPADSAVAEAPAVPPVNQPLEADGTLPEDAMRYPPAAGIAVQAPEMVAPANAAADALQQYHGSQLPAPGYYGRSMPSPPAFNYPAPMRYPRQAGYPGYSNMPPFGYYNPPVRYREQEPEVPPPPVYERQRGYGGWR